MEAPYDRGGIGVRFTGRRPFKTYLGGGDPGHRGFHLAQRSSRAPSGAVQPTYRTYRGLKLHRGRLKTTGGCKMTSSGAKVASGGWGVAPGGCDYRRIFSEIS